MSDTPAESTPDEAPKPTNVIEAILAVMREVTVLPKTERNNSPGGNYNFRGIDSTVNALGPAMRKHGLVVMPGQLRRVETRQVVTTQNKTQTAHEVEVVYKFYGPGGITDMVEAVVPGEAWASGDPREAKAMSVAERICLLQTFMLPTDERDPDADTYEQAEPIKAEEVHAILKQAQTEDDPWAYLVQHGNRLGEDRLTQLTIEVPDPTRNGERVTMNGAAVFHRWIGHYQQLAEQQTAAREARAAQAAAEGPQVAPAPAPQPGRQAPPVPPVEGGPVKAQGWPVERALRAEIALQAKVLGQQDPNKYAGWVLSQLGVASFEEIVAAHVAVVAPWVVGQRDRVIQALAAAGNAVGASSYREIRANGPLPQDLFAKLWAGDVPDAAPAAQPVTA